MLYINGRFLSQPVTGVQRVAANLLLAIDKASAADHWPECTLLVPHGVNRLPLKHIQTGAPGPRGMGPHLWEQVFLPFAARSGLLLNLAGSAPWMAARQVTMLHDAATFDTPQAYSFTFRNWYQALYRHLAKHNSGLVTVSTFSQRRLAERLQTECDRIQVIPNGGNHLQEVTSDTRSLARFGLQTSRFFLAVAGNNRNKNLEGLIAAHSRLSASNRPLLVIVGEANARVFGRVTVTNDSPEVIRTGGISDPELKALYENAVALVLPSTYEGFGLPALEAMSLGCPVIASHAAAIPEVCEDSAIYFNPESTEDMARALSQLWADSALAARLRSAGLAHVSAYSWDRSARLMLEYLKHGFLS